MFTDLLFRWLSRSSQTSATGRRPSAATPHRFRPALEILEDRIAPALYVVSTLTDNNPNGGGQGAGFLGDLRYAITQANAQGTGSSNSIVFMPGLQGVLTLQATLPIIENQLTVAGPGANVLSINGNDQGSVFVVDTGMTRSFSGLSITGGTGSDFNVGEVGGGIVNVGTVTLTACTLIGNVSSDQGGAIYNGGSLTITNSTLSYNQSNDAGAIYNTGALSITGSTFASNVGSSDGGAIDNQGTLGVTDCTFSSNYSSFDGGAIANEAVLSVSASTFANNFASVGGGGIFNSGTLTVTGSTLSGNAAGAAGSGIWQLPFAGSSTLDDTIVAGNAGGDIEGPVQSGGYNLIGDGLGTNQGFTRPGDQVGTHINPINPELGPLADNGGPTETMALLRSSPAINAGNLNTTLLPENDQRGPGFPRIVGGRADIGAYEFQSVVVAAPAAVTVVAGSGQDATVGTAYGTSLQVQITDSHGNLLADVPVTFSAPGTGPSGQFEAVAAVLTNALGIATAPAFLANSSPGTFTVTAGFNGVATLATFSLTNTAAAVTIVGGSGQDATIGTAYGTLIQVQVTDNHGNPLPNVPVTFSAPSSGPSGRFNALATIWTNAQGIATAPAFTANHIQGPFTVKASVSGVAMASFSLTNAAVPAVVRISAGSGQKTTVNHAFTTPLQVLVTDALGKPVAGISVTFELPGGGVSGTFAGSPVVPTNAHGVATAPTLTAGETAGSFTISAWVRGVVLPATFTLTSVAAAAANIHVSTGSGQSATAGQKFGTALQVLVTDQYGNPVVGVQVMFKVVPNSTSGAGALFGTSTSVVVTTDAHGHATAPLTLKPNGVKGTFIVTAIFADALTPAVFTLTDV